MTKKDKDKLLTVTERNKLKFAQGVDRVNNNILDAKDTSFLNKYYPQWSTEYLQSIIKPFSSNGYSPSSWGLNTFWSPQLNYSYSSAPLTAKEIFSGIRNSNYIGPTIGTPNGIRMNANAPKNYFILNPDIALNPTVAPVSQIGIDKMGGTGTGLGVTDAVKKADDIVSNNPLTKDMIKGSTTPGKKPGFNWKVAAPAIGSGVGMIGNHVISDGFNTETGTAIANAGNMVGQAVGTADPILGGIISAGSGLLGGFWNRGFGVKKNDKNIAAVKANTAAARNTGNELAQATDNQAVINASNNMVSGLNYSNRDLAKNGWFNHKGDDIANGLRNAENNALAYQSYGLMTGANKADKNLDEIAQYNTVAFGGPLDSLMYNNDNMGAIKYGFLSDIITSKNKQADMKNKMPGITGMPNNMFALGGPEDEERPMTSEDIENIRFWLLNRDRRKSATENFLNGSLGVPEKVTAPLFTKPSWYHGEYIDNGPVVGVRKAVKSAKKAIDKIEKKAKRQGTKAYIPGTIPSMFALGGDVQTHGADYSIGQVYDVTEEEANRLKAMGYEFKIVN